MKCLVAATAMLIGSSVLRADDVEEEVKKFEGTWVLDSASHAGKALSKEQLLERWPQLVFSRDKLTMPTTTDAGGKKDVAVLYRLDPKHKPKVLYVVPPDEKNKTELPFAVYILEKDELKIRSIDPFKMLVPKEVDDIGAVLLVYKRKK